MINFNTLVTIRGGNTMKVRFFNKLPMLLFTTAGMLMSFTLHASSNSVTQATKLASVVANNPLPQPRNDAQVWIPTSMLPNYNPNLPILVMSDGKLLQSELTNKKIQTDKDQILVITNFTSNQSKTLTIHQLSNGIPEKLTTNKTYAELGLRVGGKKDNKGILKGGQYVQVSQYQLPEDHKIGNKLMKYEGFGWESESVAYRYYYDNRGAIDVFGKQIHALTLKDVGLDGNNYHELENWGMDVLKVNNSVGLGAPAAVINNKLVKVTDFASSYVNIENLTLFSQIDLFHNQWQVNSTTTDLHTRLRIYPGSALTDVSATTNQPINNWGTGLVNHQVQYFESDNKSNWCYLASFGKQSLNKDLLGLAIFYPCKDKGKIVVDKDNIALHFAPMVSAGNNDIHYKFTAKWQAEPDGPESIEDFTQYLETTINLLNSPIAVSAAE
jgi:hypothetical protein